MDQRSGDRNGRVRGLDGGRRSRMVGSEGWLKVRVEGWLDQRAGWRSGVAGFEPPHPHRGQGSAEVGPPLKG